MLHFLHVQSFIMFAITINLWRIELPSIPVKPFLGPIESFAVRQDFLLQRDREGGDIGLFFTLVPKVFLLVGLKTLGTFAEF